MRSVASDLLYGRVRSYFQRKENVFSSDQILDRGVSFPSKDDLAFSPTQFQILNSDLAKLDLSTQLPALLLSARGSVSSGYAVLPGACLVGKEAYALFEDRLVLDSCQGRLEYPLYRGDVRSLLLRNAFPSNASASLALSLVNSLSTNYFHFLIETLPCIQRIQHAIGSIAGRLANCRLVCFVPRNRPHFIDHWISIAFGDEILLVEWCFKKVEVHNLIVHTLPYRILSPKPNPIRGVQRYLGSSLGFVCKLGISHCKNIDASQLPQKIFISRKGRTRLIINESECDMILSRHGYTKIYLEDLKIPHQVALFRGASHLVAIHGAGLTNLVFAKDCKLIELYPDNRDAQLLHYYCQLSALNNIRHIVLLCKGDKDSNVEVDLRSLQCLL